MGGCGREGSKNVGVYVGGNSISLEILQYGIERFVEEEVVCYI